MSDTLMTDFFDGLLKMPQLSIVIPTHNRPEMLINAIDSAISQTLSDIEVIVVDDGGDTPLPEGLCDHRLSIHRHSSPRGASAARNTGLKHAQSSYVAFLDDDDTLHPDFAAEMVTYMESHGEAIDFAWPALRVVNLRSGKPSNAQNRHCLIRRTHSATESCFEAAAYVRTTGMVFRSTSIRTYAGFDESLSVSEDRELIFRMLKAGCGCGSVEIPLVNFFIHDGPRLSTDENLLKQASCDTFIANRHSDFIAQHPKLASRYLNLVARRQKDAGLTKEYRCTLKALLKINPGDLRALKRLALSFNWRRTA